MRYLKNTFIYVIIVSALFSTAASAQHSPTEIKSLLTERDQEIKTLLGPEGTEYTDQQREELKEIINGVIDFDAMAKTALEETYDTISADTRTEFVDLFSTIIRDQSLTKLEIYRAKITYNDISIDGDKALVKTTAELDEVRTPVDYRMRYDGEEWVITDMSIDDVYTAESYNNQFQRIIAKRGFDALMKSLRKRANR
ncbi:MAG TPA: hypothetical protein DEQ34_02490 [Balneolaceae bacterium]|nr:hypothetical protein [Balneolaceae bacterium]